ncbi:hypothetical protein ABW20_dc0106685 [Dactylellina cionopaga]|nr:hypothetical protein ABW20_dc0106685 [Dactylellina cionopaga]
MASMVVFAVGDFASTAGLIKRVSDVLKAAGGAAEEYQNVITELEGLDRVLKAVAMLNPDDSNATYVNDAHQIALSCQHLLRQFLGRIQKYEGSLGHFAPESSVSGAFKKAKWATYEADNIQTLRTTIAAKVTSINLLLNLNIS